MTKARNALLLSTVLTLSLCVPAARAETIDGTPDAYLEYVAGENEQYIDTGVKPSIGLKARLCAVR